jgi:lysosomal Pro-X carboxypeptidase
MANERSPILPSSAAAQPVPPAAHPRRRLAFIAAALVAIVTLVVVIINVSVNFSAAKAPGASAATTSSPATASSPAAPSSFTPTVTFPADAHGSRELLPYCEEKFFTQSLNEFVADGGGGTYEQRFFVCGQQFFNKENGTIFFYTGNEADVLLYLNNTGLMWENAEEFNAVMVFAEHRYFGKSMPFGDAALDHL